MLTKNGVKIRLAISLGLFLLSGSQLITGGWGTLCGVIGTMELATALLGYSPVNDLKMIANFRNEPDKNWSIKVAPPLRSRL
ncbi:MAG: hypothetical protein VB084_13065 [Syntrophomonadaceae bacterium]|nr:hypothetical protein [Syntrophomonadaceae bacterium]